MQAGCHKRRSRLHRRRRCLDKPGSVCDDFGPPRGKDDEGVKLGRWHPRRRVESGDVSSDGASGVLRRLAHTRGMLGLLLVLAAVAALLLGGAEWTTASPDHVFRVSTTADADDAFP